jgi:hypothetical protein
MCVCMHVPCISLQAAGDESTIFERMELMQQEEKVKEAAAAKQAAQADAAAAEAEANAADAQRDDSAGESQ